MKLDPLTQMVDAFEILARRAANHPVDCIALGEQQLRQVAPVLPGDSGDQRASHWTCASLASEEERTVSSVRSREKRSRYSRAPRSPRERLSCASSTSATQSAASSPGCPAGASATPPSRQTASVRNPSGVTP